MQWQPLFPMILPVIGGLDRSCVEDECGNMET
jgi:hypothetical protein